MTVYRLKGLVATLDATSSNIEHMVVQGVRELYDVQPLTPEAFEKARVATWSPGGKIVVIGRNLVADELNTMLEKHNAGVQLKKTEV